MQFFPALQLRHCAKRRDYTTLMLLSARRGASQRYSGSPTESTDAQPCEGDDEAEADAAAEIDVDAPQERPKKKLREEVKGVGYVLVIDPAPLGRPPKPWSAIAKEHQKAQKLKKRQSAFPGGGIWSKFKKANLHDID